MNSVVRVVKQRDREAADNAAVDSAPRQDRKSSTEMIVKSWITASRERRTAEAIAYLSQVKKWQENLSLEALSPLRPTSLTN